MEGAWQPSPRGILATGCVLTAIAVLGAWRETRALATREVTRTEVVPEGARVHGFAPTRLGARSALRVSACAPGGPDARAVLEAGGARVRLTQAASMVQRCTSAVWSTQGPATVTPVLRFDAPAPRGTTLTLREGGTLGAHNAWPFIALLLGLALMVLAPVFGAPVAPRAHAFTAPADIARGIVRVVAGVGLVHLVAAMVFHAGGGGAEAMLSAVLAQNLAMFLAAAWTVGALEPGTDLRDVLELHPPSPRILAQTLAVGALLVILALLVSARVHDAGDTPAGQDIERVPLRYVIVFGGILAPLSEEIFYRGALGRLFARLGRAAVVLLPAALFTAMHVAQLRGSPLALAPIAAVGVVNGVLRLATGGVVAPWLVHTVYNVSLVSSALISD